MASQFSVLVNIGGKVNASLGAAVAQAKSQVNGLAASVAAAGRAFNAPFVNINKQLAATSKRMEKMQRAGSRATMGVTAPVGLMSVALIKEANERAKAMNTVDAVGLDDFGESPERQADRKKALAEVGAQADALSDKYGKATDILKTFNELLKAGFKVDAAKGSIESILQGAATSDDMSGADLGGYVAKLATQFRLGMDNENEAKATTKRITDALVYGAMKTSASTQDMAQSFKYVGAAAAAAGQDIEQTNAMVIAMAKGGILNSESGVSLRSAYVKLIKPTKQGFGAMSRLGLKYENYVGNGTADAKGVNSALAAQGMDVDLKAVEAAMKKKGHTAQRQALFEAVVEKMGGAAADRDKIMKSVDESFTLAGGKIDLPKLLTDLRKAGATQGDLARIFEGRQSVKMIIAMMQNLDDILKDVRKDSNGYSEKTFARLFVGLPATLTRLDASWTRLKMTMMTMILPDVERFFTKMTSALNDLAVNNPKLLKTGVYLALAAAAAGPLMFALGAVGRAAVLMSRLVIGAAMAILAPFKWAVLGIAALSRGLVAAGASALLLGGRLRTVATAMALLAVPGGAKMVMASMAAGLLAFGKSILKFPLVALRAIGAAMLFLVANPVGVLIAAITTALIGLGVWVANNWDGLKSFFAGFGDGFMKGLGPASGFVKTMADGLGSMVNWITQLVGPVGANAGEWRSWGEAVGGMAARGVNAVAQAIERVIGLFKSAIDMAKNFGSAVSNMGSGAGTATPKGPNNAFIQNSIKGARALGGPVLAGSPYLVGERGPELFVPGSHGRIETNNRLRALTERGAGAVATRDRAPAGPRSQTAHVSVKVDGGDPHAVGQAAEAAVYRVFARMENEQRGLLSD
jgi:TP901 family phage tail tape measure protein